MPHSDSTTSGMPRYLFIFALAAALLLCASSPSIFAKSADIAIIPQPLRVEAMDGSFVFGADTHLVAVEPAKGPAALLAERLRLATGHPLPILANAPPVSATRIEFRLVDPSSVGAAGQPEGYELRIESDVIEIRASESAGFLHAAQTLLQLMPPAVYSSDAGRSSPADLSIANVRISDHPRFAWRGLMIDVSRHFFSKQQLLKTIDAMAMHKLNVLHLHLTDDPGWRIEISAYPDLTHIGAVGDRTNPNGPERLYFSKDDIREIVGHARERGIMVVPEIDMPGHSLAAAKAYPEYFDGRQTVNPANPETYKFVAEVLREVMALFPSGHLHFGGDEVRNHRWAELPEMEAFMREQGYTDFREVEGHFDRFVSNFIAEQGFTPIGWDEVAEFDVHPDTIVQWWLHLRPEARDLAIKKGHRVIISPTNYLYFDYPNGPGEPGAPWEGNDNGPNSFELIHQWEPIPATYSATEESLVIGLQANLWTEFIRSNEYFEYMLYPRISALAEIAWRPKGDKDLDDFVRRLRVQCQRYEAMGLNYRQFGEWPSDFRYLTH